MGSPEFPITVETFERTHKQIMHSFFLPGLSNLDKSPANQQKETDSNVELWLKKQPLCQAQSYLDETLFF